MAAPTYGSTRKLAAAKSKEYSLVSGFNLGYRNREDNTTLPPSVLMEGSQNVLTNTNQRTSIRKGYVLDGAANTDLAPIGGQNGAMGVFDWYTSGGGERNMRAGFLTSAGNDGKLQFRHEDALGNVTWLDLVTGLTSIDFNYVTFWDGDSLQTLMIAVNGTNLLYTWNGMFATVLSGANPTGIIEQLIQPGDDNQAIVSGGVDYSVNDVLAIVGGGNNATVKVLSLTTGAIKTASVTAGGTGYAPGDEFIVDGAGTLHAVGIVDTVTGPGVVDTFHFLGRGTGYSVAAGVTTSAGSGIGTGFTVNIAAIGNAISAWEFVSDADHGTGYSSITSYTTTGGTGTGARFRVQGITSGTITKDGTETWAEAGFTFGTNAVQTVVINGVTYTYQAPLFSGDTTTLYGVTPDPSGITPGSLVVQGVNTQAIDIDNFKPDLIATLEGRLFVGSLISSFIYVGAYLELNSWELTATLVLPNPPKAIIPQEEALYISSGRDQWFQFYFVLSADLATKATTIKLLNTASQQGAQNQSATGKIANSIAFLSFEPIIEALGRVPNILAETAPQMSDLSSPIVNDMNAYDFTNAAVAYHRKYFYVAVPREGLVLVYNMTDVKNPYWEAPQVLPISRFSIINGELFGHSSLVSETYQLFTGTADRVTSTSQGQPIEAIWNFAYENYGSRFSYKKATKMYVEGYINANTTLTAKLTYELDGCKTVKTFTLDGSDSQFVCIGTDEGSLGKNSLGKIKLGGDKAAALQDLPPKFRWFPTFSNTDFFEAFVSFSVIGLNEQMELLAYGLAVSGSAEIPVQNMD